MLLLVCKKKAGLFGLGHTKMQMFSSFLYTRIFCEKINTLFCKLLIFLSSVCFSGVPHHWGASATIGEPVLSTGSRQYLILCTRRLSLFLKRLEHPPQTTLVDSEWTLRMCIVTRFLAYPMDLLEELGKYPHKPHWYVKPPSFVRTKRKPKLAWPGN